MYEVSIDELLKENDELKKKILENEVKINEKRKKLTFIKGTIQSSEKDEGLILLVIAAVSALLFPLGFIIIPFLLLRNKKTNTLHKLVYVICICSFAVNLFDMYGYLGNYFGWGETTVEQLD